MSKKHAPISVTRPTLEPYKAYEALFRRPVESGMLTISTNVRELEAKVARYLGVKYVVAVSSCTSGLMLALQGFKLKGEVIVPSFTFCASALPVVWNGLTPVFADVDPRTYCLDPESVKRLITKRTSAILATHVFGVPCDTTALAKIAKTHKLKLIYDAAHAFGSARGKARIGTFGDVEVFSCSPTKVFTTGEGGIVATNNKKLADYVRQGRNYGEGQRGRLEFAGLSARMPELSAAIGLRSLERLPQNLKKRHAVARTLIRELTRREKRLRFQEIPSGTRTTYKDLSVYIDPVIGFSRDELHDFFATKGIMTRKYFFPSLHQQPAYKAFSRGVRLPITEDISSRVLSLPLYAHLSTGDVRRIVKAFEDFLHDRQTH